MNKTKILNFVFAIIIVLLALTSLHERSERIKVEAELTEFKERYKSAIQLDSTWQEVTNYFKK